MAQTLDQAKAAASLQSTWRKTPTKGLIVGAKVRLDYWYWSADSGVARKQRDWVEGTFEGFVSVRGEVCANVFCGTNKGFFGHGDKRMVESVTVDRIVATRVWGPK